jgi:hypothetical protein
MSIATQISALQTDKTNIASAITNKGGTVNSGDGFDNFADDILTISASTPTQTKSVTITTNTTTTVQPDSGYALSEVTVVTNVGKPDVQAIGQKFINLQRTSAGATNIDLSTQSAVTAFTGLSKCTGITLPARATVIYSFAFSFRPGTVSNPFRFEVPATVTAIYDDAFCRIPGEEEAANEYKMNITFAERTSNLTIWAYAFRYTKGDSIVLPAKTVFRTNNRISAPDKAFFRTNLKSVDLSACTLVTKIGKRMFYEATTQTVLLPSTVTSIDNEAFFGASNLNNLVIPSGVTSIGDYAFADIGSANEIHIQCTTPPTLGTDVFGYVIPTIYVPIGTLNDYLNDSSWSVYSSYLTEESS